ncbi:uncharacterized protein LOC144907139 isoform X2 [Branchiostoma floridae x Branchiostoma belcheri]
MMIHDTSQLNVKQTINCILKNHSNDKIILILKILPQKEAYFAKHERYDTIFDGCFHFHNANHKIIPPMRSNAMFTRVAMDTGSNSTHSTSFVLTNQVFCVRASALRITEENPYETMSSHGKMTTENDLSQTGGGDQSTQRKLTNESDQGRLKPGQESDAASLFSESATMSKLVQGSDHESQVASQSHGVSSGIPTHGLPDADRVLISLRPSVRKTKDKAELEQLTEQPTSTPSAASVVTGTPQVSTDEESSSDEDTSDEESSDEDTSDEDTSDEDTQKPSRLHHGDHTGETTDSTPVPLPESARHEGFVLYRDSLGEWFRFLASDDHILERLFSGGEELYRLYCRTGAVDRQATLPVGRLRAIDGLRVYGLTDLELLDVINTSVDPVFDINPEIQMVKPTTLQSLISEPVPSDHEETSDDEESSDEDSSDEDSSDEDTSDEEESSDCSEEDEEDTRENGDTQQQVGPVRKRGRLATFFSRCRKAFTSCWRRR